MQDNTNTTFGWVLFSGIVALGLSIGSGMYYHADAPELNDAGFPVEDAEAGAAADSGPSLATLLVTGDAAAGERVFAKCVACHTIDAGGANGIGPNVYGIMGKPIGQTVAGFAYSSALSGHGGNWGFEEMDAWLKSPRGFANGTKMSFAGLSSGEDRANVMLYMLQNGGGPALPEPEPEPEPDATEGDAIDDAVEGGEVSPVDAAGGASDLTAIPASGPAT
ncbi:c-type cytochrome [Altererythrobacter sp. MF3-039]|uniref:c-type cytochrome n=1 Tax=Altererythrobacter sp. MF3-039 TaxID=3252901 RepID=UPI00390CD81A